MYRTAPPNYPPPPDPLLVVPGEGLRDVWVGRATAAEVLRAFGDDCQVARFDSGEIFKLDYDCDHRNVYLPDRPAQATRPSGFDVEFGLVKAIHVGVYQHGLYTTGGLRIGSTHDDVVAVLGRDCEVLEDGEQRLLRYVALGIQLTIATRNAFGVSGYVVFRAAR